MRKPISCGSVVELEDGEKPFDELDEAEKRSLADALCLNISIALGEYYTEHPDG